MRELLKASYYDKWNYINGKTYWVLTTSLVLQSRTGANQVPPKQQDTNHVPLKQSTGTSNDLTRQNFMIPNNKTNALAIMNFIEVFNVQWIYISVSRRYLEFNKKSCWLLPENLPSQKNRMVFQPSFFSGFRCKSFWCVTNQPKRKAHQGNEWLTTYIQHRFSRLKVGNTRLFQINQPTQKKNLTVLRMADVGPVGVAEAPWLQCFKAQLAPSVTAKSWYDALPSRGQDVKIKGRFIIQTKGVAWWRSF